ncbi:FtsW/RodA/SpoVE family cell cycle protein [Paucilactobacillus nenjiangensis]|uniref:FtsW/RodA/SpoVE family cell cycle protein n=1 Tax=Paucilactobacillus nenjiangensis TaxID=1296540 RepID=UPI003F9E38E3
MRRGKLRFLDYWLFVPYILLCMIGLVMVYSASSDITVQNGGTPTGYLIKQGIYVILGLLVLILMTAMNIDKWRHPIMIKTFFFVVVAMMLYVLFAGQSVNGAKGWINLPFMSIQPVEICKLLLILYVADIFAKHQKTMSYGLQASFHELDIFKMYIWIVALIGLIAIQPDTGGAAINLAIVVVMILASGINWKWGASFIVLGTGALMIILGPVATHIASSGSNGSYKLARFVAFANPFGTARGAGNQLVNSYYAIAHGGLFGVGLGNSIQKMGYLPEPNTDFILAIIAEEMGVLFVIMILFLLGIIIVRTVWVGVRCQKTYESLICYGVATFFAVETFFNVGGVTGLVPITGVTFPFISYGGSSMLVLCASLGLVINISSQQKRLKVVK